ncbi:MAG TPA: glycosyltransferase [Steroidobacteraceae bacterium]|nr:glycosyltransferase [Steroidobacteraceae bacterium]
MKRLLIIAFHYPPFFGSSGILRTLKFSEYIPENNWECSVLTASPGAYSQSAADERKGAALIPRGVAITRTFALDAKRLSIGGYYPSLAALPDRWISWWPGAMLAGLRIIRSWRPDVIFSTYPIATTHLIAYCLARWTGVPWVADFRDSMTEENYPTDARQRRVYRWIERKTVAAAACVVFTTRGTATMYRERYPQIPADRWQIVPNGYDEDMFRAFDAVQPTARGNERVTLLHTGILYPHERDPRAFFRAVAALKQQGTFAAGRVRIVFRATGHDDVIARMLAESGIADIVELAPSIPYQAALREMLEADGLLVFQAANSNHQIPAKTYEYMRAGRPILAVTDPAGDTAELLRSSGIDSIARIDDATDIELRLASFLQQIRAGTAVTATPEAARQYSRRAQAAAMAALLNEVAAARRDSSPQQTRGAIADLTKSAE